MLKKNFVVSKCALKNCIETVSLKNIDFDLIIPEVNLRGIPRPKTLKGFRALRSNPRIKDMYT